MNGLFGEALFVTGGNTLTHSPKHVKDRVEGRKGSSYWILVRSRRSPASPRRRFGGTGSGRRGVGRLFGDNLV